MDATDGETPRPIVVVGRTCAHLRAIDPQIPRVVRAVRSTAPKEAVYARITDIAGVPTSHIDSRQKKVTADSLYSFFSG